eukprot:1147721-Pelagomonas_calceolata.AAC.3
MQPEQLLTSHDQTGLTGAPRLLTDRGKDLACCVHGYWTDAINWRGAAGFLLRRLGELTHTRASLLGA